MIEIRNVSKQFQNETAIDYKDITFESGKSYMLLGASGCGKSTLLNMIAGILSPTSGAIIIDGVNMQEKSQGKPWLYVYFISLVSVDGCESAEELLAELEPDWLRSGSSRSFAVSIRLLRALSTTS